MTARGAWIGCLAAAAVPVLAADPGELINPNDPGLAWRSYLLRDDTCVLAATAVSEKRDDAFEIQFRRSRHQKMRFFVIIPGLPGGGRVFIESPTTRDRWRISTDNYTPALEGERAEAIHRNAISGIPIAFTFEFPPNRRVVYETMPASAVDSAVRFSKCIEYIERPLVPEKS